jgi:hypothetical protein
MFNITVILKVKLFDLVGLSTFRRNLLYPSYSLVILKRKNNHLTDWTAVTHEKTATFIITV